MPCTINTQSIAKYTHEARRGGQSAVLGTTDRIHLRDSALTKLTQVKGRDAKGWFTALCVFHDDNRPSLRIAENGFRCMGCGRKGSLRELAAELGIEVEPTRSEKLGRNRNGGVSLRQLAAGKGLPLDFLRDELGWHDVEYYGLPAVAIPCFDSGGVVLREQLRLRLARIHRGRAFG